MNQNEQSEIQKTVERLKSRAAALKSELAEIEPQIRLCESLLRNANIRVVQTVAKNGRDTIAERIDEFPDVTVTEIALQGFRALGEFAKKDVDRWIRKTNPKLIFSSKTLDRPIRDLIDKGKIEVKSKNIGNKRPTIYRWIGEK